jgi:UDP-N-acetyl-D-galactosamine dehydrogenase
MTDPAQPYDVVIATVAHEAYRQLPSEGIEALVASGGMLADIKGIWRDVALSPRIDRWTL